MPAAIVELQHGDYLISTDPGVVDLVAVHRFMSEDSYWAQGRPFEVQRRAIEHSASVVGAYTSSDVQVGFARMVTDLATWAWLCDVYVLPEHRGEASARRSCARSSSIPTSPKSAGSSSRSCDADDLYAKFGYRPLDDPARWMHRGVHPVIASS